MPVSSSSSVFLPAFIFTFFTSLLLTSAAHHHHHRHLLHEEYPPLVSLRRTTQSIDPSLPSPPPPPDYPFFPETSIPPPPPLPPPPPTPSNAPFASFPANISALTLPQEHKSSKGASSKLIAGAFAAVVAAIILVVFSTFLHFRKRRNREVVDSKSNRFEENRSRLHHNNSVNLSTGAIPVIERPLKLSSEFLYLGTLVDSHGGIDYAVDHSDSVSNSSSTAPAGNSFSNLRTMGSPELRPLPPLKGKNVSLNHGNSELCSCSEDDYDNDDLYSLKWSGMGRNNSIRTDSATELGKFARDCSCSSFSSSASGSPLRSTSLSVSPPVSLSPERSTVKPPELVSAQLIPPPSPISPPVIPSGSSSKCSLIYQKESPSLLPSHFPSLPRLASPARVDNRSRDSSPRISNFSDHDLDSPLKISCPDHQNVQISVPSSPPRSLAHPASVHLPPSRPPPRPSLPLCNEHCGTSPQEDNGFVLPPSLPLCNEHCEIPRTSPLEDNCFVLPPSRPPPRPSLPLFNEHCEIPRTPPQEDNGFLFDPPVLATPVRPSSMESDTFISPTQLHSYSEDTQNKERIIDLNEKTNANAEKKIENPYVKMEPLQWDKATVNSMRNDV